MGAGDLNSKKSWHPASMVNQAKVWEREQFAIQERRKAEQVRKEKEEERLREELRKEQGVGGRLDWMYQTPGTSGNQWQEKEDYLLGKRIEKIEEEKKVETGLPSVYGATANTLRDVQQKVREDPMLMIKRREQEALKQILSDPRRVKELERRKKRDRSRDRSVDRSRDKRSRSEDRRRDRSRDRKRDRSRDRSREERRDRSRDKRRDRSRDKRRDRSRDKRRDRSRDKRRDRSRDRDSRRDDYRKRSKSPPLTDNQERQRKLQEMMQNAKQEEDIRSSRVENHQINESTEQKEDLKKRMEGMDGWNAAFGSNDVLGKDVDMAEAIQRRKHLSARIE